MLSKVLHRLRGTEPPEPAVPASPAAVEMSPGELLKEFESLGDNCEFGLAQRYCGGEPLGLFRFSFSHLPNLQHALDTGLAEYGAPDDLEVLVTEHNREFVCRSRRYGDFTYHTELFEGAHDPAGVHAREVRKVAYLKRRLGDDLASAEKIFVRKGSDSTDLETMRALVASLRRHGDNELLWVVESDEDHPPGTVERLKEGVIRGWTTRFARLDRAQYFDLEMWVHLCRAAYALRIGRPVRLTPPARLERGDRWILTMDEDPGFVDEPVLDMLPPFPGAVLTRFTRLAGSGAASVARPDIAPRERMPERAVFTTWVWIPEDFDGALVDLVLFDSSNLYIKPADLTRRGVWQKIWSSSKPRPGTGALGGRLRMSAAEGASLVVSTWMLEEGSVPGKPPACEVRHAPSRGG